MNDKKNIFICPLEWGLGHAGRMVPLARRLQELNHNIIFGSGTEHLSFFRSEVPGAEYVHFPGFRIKYSRYLPQYIAILLRSPLLLYHAIVEHQKLKKIIKAHSIDIVISDNRIGLWNKTVKSVFVTHQLRIPFPKPFRFLEFIGIRITRSIIKKYTLCFIPDLEGELNVSGKLSHGLIVPGNVRYIGLLSRFDGHYRQEKMIPGRCTVILSGPEPQRTMLRQKLIKILSSQGTAAVILEGKPGNTEKSDSVNNILYHNHLSQVDTIRLLTESESVITRSGYTTIMELISLGRSALLIPTPGQTEQEYLAEHLSQKGWFRKSEQRDLNNNTNILSASEEIPAGLMKESDRVLEIALKELLKK